MRAGPGVAWTDATGALPIVDARTVCLMVGVVSLVFGILHVFVVGVHPKNTALLLWGSANILGGAGAILISRRVQPADLLTTTIPLGNALFAAYFGLSWAAMRAFAGSVVRWSLVMAPIVGQTVALSVLPDDAGHRVPRLIIATLISLLYCTLIIRDGLAAERSERLLMRRIVLAVVVATTSIYACQLIVAVVAPRQAIRVDGNLQLFTVVLALAMLIVVNVCVILMVRERHENELSAALNIDRQTGVLNYHGLYAHGQTLVEEHLRDGRSVAILMADIDGFKSFNDCFGHSFGDLVLRQFTAVVNDVIRDGDLFARCGGDEFCVVLADTSLEQAAAIAERIRKACDAPRSEAAAPLAATVSIGIAMVERPHSLELTIAAADRAMYAAKQAGRNRVCCAGAS